MANKKILLDRLVRCPKCKRNMRPRVLDEVEAFPNAQPPIPARMIGRCQAIRCGQKFYVVKDAN